MTRPVYDRNSSVPAAFGISARLSDPSVPAVLEPYPEICVHGRVRAAATVMIVDMMSGFMAEQSADSDWVFTADLFIRVPDPTAPTTLTGTTESLRVGRTLTISDVTIVSEDGPWGYGQASFSRIARRHGDPAKPHLNPDVDLGAVPRLTVPLHVAAGLVIDDAATGRVTFPLHEGLRNPAGALQGAIVALAGEDAARAFVDHHQGGSHVVADMTIRYLAMGREGPVWTRAEWIGQPGSGQVLVSLHDAGADDRLISSMTCRLIAAPEK